jgi:hypothetical protein
MAKRKITKAPTMIYKTLHSEQHEPHWKPGVNSSAPEGWTIPASLVAPVVLL